MYASIGMPSIFTLSSSPVQPVLKTVATIHGPFGGGHTVFSSEVVSVTEHWSVECRENVVQIAFKTSNELAMKINKQISMIDSGMGMPFTVTLEKSYGDRHVSREVFMDCAMSAATRDQNEIFATFYWLKANRTFYDDQGNEI